jgi:signal transduction histidine kinase
MSGQFPEHLKPSAPGRDAEGVLLKSLSARATPWIILVVSLLATAFAWNQSNQLLNDKTRARYHRAVEQIEIALRDRLRIYEAILRGGQGLFDTNENLDVTREEWRRYVERLKLSELYPGLLAVGFSIRVPRAALAVHVKRIRSEGFPNYAIRPEGKRSEYHSVIYLEPFNDTNRRYFGYDMFFEPVHRLAMERARDTGQLATSGKVSLARETDRDVQAGFLVYLPVYRGGRPPQTVEKRRRMLLGFVFSPFRINHLMSGLVAKTLPTVAFQIFDGGQVNAAALMYDGIPASQDGHRPAFYHTSPFEFGGHTWTLSFSTLPTFEHATEHSEPILVAAGGLVISLLLFGLTRSLAKTHERAQVLAIQMTTELNKSRTEIAAKNRDLETLLYVTSHDLREPLRAIENFARLVHDRYAKSLDDNGKDFLMRIVRGAKRLDQLLLDILTVSRAQRMETKPVEVSGEDIVRETLSRMAQKIRETGASIHVLDGLSQLRVDKTWATAALYNLIGNALKFTRDGESPDVEIGPYRDADSQKAIGIAVRDRGPGIAPEHAARIFQLFQRAVGREVEGTGAGLAIVKQIAQRQGGDAWVEARVGGGSVFIVTFGKMERESTQGWTPNR